MIAKQQAGGIIHEDRLLDFLVNALIRTFSRSLGENVEIDTDNIFEVSLRVLHQRAYAQE